MKLCKDCIHYKTTSERCDKQPSPVTGKAVDRGLGWRGSPAIQREDGFIVSIIMNTCGNRGRWFKSANVESSGAGLSRRTRRTG